MVCPMRVLLVVVSTALAGYFAWKSWSRSKDAIISPIEADKDELEPSVRVTLAARVGVRLFFINLFVKAHSHSLSLVSVMAQVDIVS